MRDPSSTPLEGTTTLRDITMRDVHIAYKCDAFEDRESMELVQNLLESAVERLLAKARRTMGENGPLRICVEHCQKRKSADPLLGDLRYLKVYVEGQGPCIVMAY